MQGNMLCIIFSTCFKRNESSVHTIPALRIKHNLKGHKVGGECPLCTMVFEISSPLENEIHLDALGLQNALLRFGRNIFSLQPH